MEKKERLIYFAPLRNGDAENFFGPVVYMGQVDQLLVLRHLDPAPTGDALLEVVLQGITSGPHRVKVLINEVEVGEVSFEGQSQGVLRVEVSHAGLLEGENLVSLVAQGDEMDASLLDSIRLTYWHTYTADENILKFTAQGGRWVSVSGFSHPKVRVIDITEPSALLEVMGKVGAQEGGYSITFKVPGMGLRTLLGFTEERVRGPWEVVANQPSSWHLSRNGYDFVIITHRYFIDSLQPLKILRESQGLRVALVDVEDLYDEFSFGVKSPRALRDFLKLAREQWRKPPRFVLLVGDASFDPRNYFGLGDYDFVPTKLVDTTYFETAADDWFVDFNGDGLPEMAIGRLPVRTLEQAQAVIAKIISYEQSAGSGRDVVLVADMNGEDFDFEGASAGVKAFLPGGVMVSEIFRSRFVDDVQVRGALLGRINQGPLLVNYFGHGSVEIWAGFILTSEDVGNLANGINLAFFVNMTCLNGFFHDLYTDSLAEALLRAETGGAVAVWASSGLTDPDKQVIMNKELMRLLFNGEFLTLGEATVRAKASVGDQDIRRTWILFGDPTTRLKY